MTRKLLISDQDINFLLRNLSLEKNLQTKLINKNDLSEDDIADLWDLCSDLVVFEFDDSYNISDRGRYIEGLIDKLYDMGENYPLRRQYKLSKL